MRREAEKVRHHFIFPLSSWEDVISDLLALFPCYSPLDIQRLADSREREGIYFATSLALAIIFLLMIRHCDYSSWAWKCGLTNSQNHYPYLRTFEELFDNYILLAVAESVSLTVTRLSYLHASNPARLRGNTGESEHVYNMHICIDTAGHIDPQKKKPQYSHRHRTYNLILTTGT